MHREVLKHVAFKHMSSSVEASEPLHMLKVCVRLPYTSTKHRKSEAGMRKLSLPETLVWHRN